MKGMKTRRQLEDENAILRETLTLARDDLYKAANQFAQLLPEGRNWRIFEGKAERADVVLCSLATEGADDARQ